MKNTKKNDLMSASKKVLAMAEKREARMAKRKATAKAEKTGVKKSATKRPVKAARNVRALDQNAPPNGGFEGTTLSPADNANLGAEDIGISLPPELEKAIEEGKGDAGDDASYQPGILIPPGLEDAIMAVTDPAEFAEDEEVNFDLVPFVPEEASTAAEVMEAGAHWVLFANGDPIAKVSLKDQDHAKEIAAHFVSHDFARSVIDGIKKHGLMAALSAVKAKTYVAKVDANKKIAQIKANLAASTQEALRQQVSQVKARYIGTLGHVLEASANNFIVQNPLKDALIVSIRSAGLPEATAAEMVDDAFFQQGIKTFAGLLDKAEEWSNLSAEALSEILSAMQAAGKRVRPLPSERSHAATNPNYDQNLANQMAARAVPLQASHNSDVNVSASVRRASPEPVDAESKTNFRNRFGGFR